MSVDKELWIDLHCLASSSVTDGDFATIYMEYQPTSHDSFSHVYLLRKAIRAVGFKITRWHSVFDNENNLILESFYTDIPKALWDSSSSHYNEWIEEVETQYYPSCKSDSESEPESEDTEPESEDTDPVTASL